jgi:GNAT superfamily N-acetyltransferase
MFSIRATTIRDVPLLKRFIQELAEYEHEPNAAVISEEQLLHDGFGPQPKFRAILAEDADSGQPAGYAVFFPCYSTWTGPGMFLEDLFVRVPFRGRGVGKALLAEVTRIAQQEGFRSIRLDVLDWNEPAIRFYQSLGAEYLEQWHNVVIREEALDRLAHASRLAPHP